MGSKSAFLNIFLGDRIVGRLEKTNYGQMQFYYDSSWLNFEQNLPISLSLPLTSKVYAGEIVESFFRNLLPDNQVILNRIRSRLRISSTHPFDLLASIGRDCVGALQFLKPTETPQKIESKQLPSNLWTSHACQGVKIKTNFIVFMSLPRSSGRGINSEAPLATSGFMPRKPLDGAFLDTIRWADAVEA